MSDVLHFLEDFLGLNRFSAEDEFSADLLEFVLRGRREKDERICLSSANCFCDSILSYVYSPNLG